MAKLTYGPIVSDARGSISGTTFSRWKQTGYARRKTTPANPDTAAQQSVRNAFRSLQNIWQNAPSGFQTAWNDNAAGRNYTGRNHYIGINIPIINGLTTLNGLVVSPGDPGTAPPLTFTVTPGNDQLTLAATVDTPPVGWVTLGVVFGVLQDFNPNVPQQYNLVYSTDTTSAYSVVFAGLLNATLYQCFAYVVYTLPDGSTRRGRSMNTTGLTT